MMKRIILPVLVILFSMCFSLNLKAQMPCKIEPVLSTWNIPNCETQVSLEVEVTHNFMGDYEIIWDFGDGYGAFSTGTNPTAGNIFMEFGNYEVCVSLVSSFCDETYCQVLEIGIDEEIDSYSTFFQSTETTKNLFVFDGIQGSDGNFYMVGIKFSPNKSRLVFIKQSPDGSIEETYLQQEIGSPDEYLLGWNDADFIREMFIQESFGINGISEGFYIATSLGYQISVDKSLMLVNPDGEIQWIKHDAQSNGNENVVGLIANNDGTIVLTNESDTDGDEHHFGYWFDNNSASSVVSQYPLIAFPSGTNFFPTDFAESIQPGVNQPYFITCGIWEDGNSKKIGLIFSPQLSVESALIYDLFPGEDLEKLVPTSILFEDDLVYVSGFFEKTGELPKGFVMAVSALNGSGTIDGEPIWTKVYFDDLLDFTANGLKFFDSALSEKGDVLLTGPNYILNFDVPYLLSIDENGEIQYSKNFKETGSALDFGSIFNLGLDISQNNGFNLFGTMVNEDETETSVWSAKIDNNGKIRNCDCYFDYEIDVEEIFPTVNLFSEFPVISTSCNILIPEVSLLNKNLSLSACDLPPTVPDVCDLNNCSTDTLIINTGYNHFTNSTYVNGSFDNFWELVEAPNPNITVPQPALVIPTYFPNQIWTEQSDTKWLSAYPQSELGINNSEPQPPYTFKNCFCVCSDSSEVDIFMSIYADDFVSVNLTDEFSNQIVTLENHLGFRPNTPSGMVDTTIILDKGNYCISAGLRNLGAKVMGLNIKGHLVGTSLITPVCCQEPSGTILGAKFHDKNCNGEKGHPFFEEGLSDWEIQLCDFDGNIISSTFTDVSGFYIFSDVPFGSYIVKEVDQVGWQATNLASENGYVVNLDSNNLIVQNDFANKLTEPLELISEFECEVIGEPLFIYWQGGACDCELFIEVISCENNEVITDFTFFNFGNGAYHSTANIPPGEYRVMLTNCDGSEQLVSECFSYVEMDLLSSYEANDCGQVIFTASSSFPVEFVWSIGDLELGTGSPLVYDFISGQDFNISLTATTDDGCTKSDFFQISITPDQEAPNLNCPADISIEENSSISPDITGFATATDNCDDDIMITYVDEINGECPNIITITRTWTATDDWGNESSCEQIITLFCIDVCFVSLSWETVGGGCYFVKLLPDYSLLGPNPTSNWTLNGNPVNPIGGNLLLYLPGPGNYLVCLDASSGLCTADACTNVSLPIQNPPTISCPSDITLSANSIDCENDSYSPNIQTSCVCNDDLFVAACDPICTRSDEQEIDDSWPLGVTTVTCYTLDNFSISSDTCQFTVTVEDNEAPTCIGTDSVIVEGDFIAGGINVDFVSPQAFDNCGELDITCNYQSGDFFLCGTTKEVICTAIDSYGNSTDCVLPITVICPSVECCTDTLTFCNRFDQGFQVSSNECTVLFDPIAMDTCDLVQIDWGDGVVENIAGDEFSTHEYDISGDYQICILAFMPAEDGSVCFGKSDCYDICVTCEEECENATFGKLWTKSLSDYVSIGEPETDVLYEDGKTFVVGGFNGAIDFGGANGNLSTEPDNTDAFLVELDAMGDAVKAVKIGGEDFDVANSVARDSDGNIYVGGWFRSHFLNVYNGNGSVAETLTNAHGGNCPNTSPCRRDIFVAKYKPDFTLDWAKSYGSAQIDVLYDLEVDGNDQLIGTGRYSHNAISFHQDGVSAALDSPLYTAGFVFKLFPNGDHDWSFSINSEQSVDQSGYSIEIGELNSVYVSGDFAGKVDFKGKSPNSKIHETPADDYEAGFIAKYDSAGQNEWVIDLIGEYDQEEKTIVAYDMELVGDNLYVAGQTQGIKINFGATGQPNDFLIDVGIPYLGAFVAKYDANNGHCQWVNGFDINGKCFNLSVDNQENVVISGFFHRYGNALDMNPDPAESFILNSNFRDGFIAKYNSEGAFVTAFGALSPNGVSQFQSIDHDNYNNLIVVGSNSSNAMDDDPVTDFHPLLNSGDVSDFFIGKYDCSCTPTDTDCCENLSATIEQINDDTCCYAITLQNDYGLTIPYITLKLETEDWIFNEATLADGFNIVGFANQAIFITHDSGSIPNGSLEEVIEVCLTTDNMEAALIQFIQVDWFAYGIVPGHGGSKSVCTDILETDCDPGFGTNCLVVVDTILNCDNSIPNEYELTFSVTNLTDLEAVALFINDEMGTTTFRTCDNPPILANTNLSYSLQPNPLMMGETSEEICLKIAPNQTVLEPTLVCYSLVLEGDGSTQCCNEPVEFCFTLEPCCDPCEMTNVTSTQLEDCCYALDVINECPPNFFTRIETVVITEGVEFGGIQAGTDEFNFNVISADTINWFSKREYIPTGNFEDAIQFCLTGITEDTPPQEVVVNWYAIIPGSIEEVLRCSDTLNYVCMPIDEEDCLDLSDVEICYIEEDGIYELSFTAKNIANPEFIGEQILVSTNQGFSIPGASISANLMQDESLVTTIQFTTNPFPTELDSFEFIFTMKSITGDTCCQKFKKLVTPIPPNPDNDCISVSTYEIVYGNTVLVYPNPFTNGFTINFNKPITTNTTIKLFDTFGKTVHQSILLKGNTEIQLQPNGLASGIYFLQISDDEGRWVTKKVVQQ